MSPHIHKQQTNMWPIARCQVVSFVLQPLCLLFVSGKHPVGLSARKRLSTWVDDSIWDNADKPWTKEAKQTLTGLTAVFWFSNLINGTAPTYSYSYILFHFHKILSRVWSRLVDIINQSLLISKLNASSNKMFLQIHPMQVKEAPADHNSQGE